jgi:hypothetical protein
MFCPGACTGTGGGTGGSGAAGAGAIDAGTANNMCPQGTFQIPLTGASTCDGGMGSYTIHIAPASAGMFSVEQTSMNSLSTPSCDALQTGTGTFDGKTLTVTYPDTTGSCPQHKGQVVLTPDASCNTLMTNGMYTEMGCGSCTAGTCSGCGTMTCTTNYGAGTYMRIGQ